MNKVDKSFPDDLLIDVIFPFLYGEKELGMVYHHFFLKISLRRLLNAVFETKISDEQYAKIEHEALWNYDGSFRDDYPNEDISIFDIHLVNLWQDIDVLKLILRKKYYIKRDQIIRIRNPHEDQGNEFEYLTSSYLKLAFDIHRFDLMKVFLETFEYPTCVIGKMICFIINYYTVTGSKCHKDLLIYLIRKFSKLIRSDFTPFAIAAETKETWNFILSHLSKA